METVNTIADKIIGKGRSGQVIKAIDNTGNELAIKVFSGVDGLTNFVNYFITGAPNPYAWNEDAVKSAHYRRQILSLLVEFWFGSRVKIAQSFGTSWNEGEKAYQISTQFVNAKPASLHHPFSSKSEWELIDLSRKIMPLLQKKLEQAGFDGIVWQAGKGNPVALNNFLLDGNGTWVWIDAESGVPALFPLNLFTLLSFYIPKSIKHRGVLFDDVDTKKLYNYTQQNKQKLVALFGDDKFIELEHKIVSLENHQVKWKSVKRIQKGISYQLKKEKISAEQADYYSRHPLLWTLRVLGQFLKKAAVKLGVKLPRKIYNYIISLHYWSIIKNSFRFIFNGQFRTESVEKLVKARISDWEERGQLTLKQPDFLREQAEHESTSPYLADFIILIGLKPIMNFVELGVLPSLYAAGYINEGVLAIGVSLGGIIYRTIYTVGKMIYEGLTLSRENRHPRWIALFIGLIPTFGNAAYPAQMVYSASHKSKELSEFLLYDIFARIGQKIPIWGGKDTLTEHWFNHIPDILIRKRKSLQPKILRHYAWRSKKKDSQVPNSTN